MPSVGMPKGLMFWAGKTAVAIVREPEREAELMETLFKRCAPVPPSPLGEWMEQATGEKMGGSNELREVIASLVQTTVQSLRADTPEAVAEYDAMATLALQEIADEETPH